MSVTLDWDRRGEGFASDARVIKYDCRKQFKGKNSHGGLIARRNGDQKPTTCGDQRSKLTLGSLDKNYGSSWRNFRRLR